MSTGQPCRCLASVVIEAAISITKSTCILLPPSLSPLPHPPILLLSSSPLFLPHSLPLSSAPPHLHFLSGSAPFPTSLHFPLLILLLSVVFTPAPLSALPTAAAPPPLLPSLLP